MKLRFIDASAEEGIPGALNMGIDETLLLGLARGDSEACLRFYTWKPACVTIGYFQSLEDEVDLAACAKAGVDAVRRLTGGGAVFHHHELTYSLVLPPGHPLAPDDILESYRMICAGIVEALSVLGLEARFAPINDIVVEDRKISGNAQTRKYGCLLQHGTILLDCEPELMFSLLKIPAEKLKGRLVEEAKARVIGLRSLLGRGIGAGEAGAALAAGCAKAWQAELLPSSLSEEEAASAARLATQRFSEAQWNARR